jgi:hypothetical protein
MPEGYNLVKVRIKCRFFKKGIHILESNLSICTKRFKDDLHHSTTEKAYPTSTKQ